MVIRKKRRIKWKNVFLALFVLICLVGLGTSLFNIIKWKIEAKTTNNQIETAQKVVKPVEIIDNDKIEIIEQEKVPLDDPYWDYVQMNLIDVDFNDLKNINPSTIGWIQVNGTNINYPFVQTNDNKYYLNHSFNKSKNSAGWVFMDYRNNISVLDKNTIIYAHGRLDNTMFGSLKNILTSGWLNNKNNYIVKLSTEYENNLWQVFSIYKIKTTNDYLQISFISNESFLEFTDKLIKRSNFNFNTKVNENDKILTLSTCYNEKEKVVLHAKLIKRVIK
ncbi:MAG: class B sortase [Bacilli bacterium]